MIIDTEKWNMGWLQWGLELNFITESAKEELKQLEIKHPDWNAYELARMLRDGKLKPETISHK